MEHQGFSIVHVQSPCTTYNDTFEEFEGQPLARASSQPSGMCPKTTTPAARARPTTCYSAAACLRGRVCNQEENRPALEQRVEHMWDTARARSADELMAAFEF